MSMIEVAMATTRVKLTPEQRRAVKVERNKAVSEKAWARYQQELGGVARREAERQFQQDGIDYIDGLDTEGARRFAAEVARRLAAVTDAERRIAVDGNPLRINGPKAPLPEAARRKVERKQMTAAGYQAEPVTVIDPRGIAERAEPWQGPASFRRMGFQDQQILSAELFRRDWGAAHRTLKGQTWEMPVDGQGGAHNGHLARVQAQSQLRACQEEIGRRNFEIVVAVVVNGATCQRIHAMGGNQHVVVKSDMNTAFDALDGFYHGTRRKDRTWDAIERFNAERAAMIEQAEREVG